MPFLDLWNIVLYCIGMFTHCDRELTGCYMKWQIVQVPAQVDINPYPAE